MGMILLAPDTEEIGVEPPSDWALAAELIICCPVDVCMMCTRPAINIEAK